MIRKLRKRHLRWFGLLAVLIPAGMIAGLAARPEPIAGEGPKESFGQSAGYFAGSIGSGTLIQLRGTALDLVVVLDQLGQAIQVSNLLETDLPEALVYFSRHKPRTAEELPLGATLLGELGGAKSSVWDLPTDRGAGQGFVIVYSLGHKAILAWGALESPQEASVKKG